MMFQLKPLDNTVRKEYVDKIMPGLVRRIQTGRTHKYCKYELSTSAKNILLPGWNTKTPDTEILSKILSDEPKELIALNSSLMKQFNRLGKKSPSSKTIEILFNYDGVFKDKTTSYWLSKLIQRNTCTYCNRQYIFTVERNPAKTEKDYIARPVFDHWFAKSDYPLLSLSLHNLIPSCTVCNSSIKGATPMSITKHIHPYINEPVEANFTFRATKAASSHSHWELKIDRKAGSRIDNTIKEFALDEVYALHATLEVKDIMDFHDAYPLDYIKTLFEDMLIKNNCHLTQEEVYRILFGTEMDSDKYLDRPFSKLKYDLLKQIEVIK